MTALCQQKKDDRINFFRMNKLLINPVMYCNKNKYIFPDYA